MPAGLDHAALTQAALLQQLASAGLLAARVAPIVLLAPWLLAGLAPRLTQAALVLVLVTCLLPASGPLGALPTSLLPWLALAARELLIGLVLGCSLALPVLALRWAGELIHAGVSDVLGGGASLAFDEEPQAPAIAQLYTLLAIALFMTLGGHRLAIAAIAESLRTAPLGAIASFGDPARFGWSCARLLGSALTTATFIALPALIALGLSDLVLGWIARAASAPFVTALLPSTRAIALLAVLWMGMLALLDFLPEHFAQALRAAAALWSTR